MRPEPMRVHMTVDDLIRNGFKIRLYREDDSYAEMSVDVFLRGIGIERYQGPTPHKSADEKGPSDE